MLKVETITKDWREAGSFPAQLNLYGFWDEHCFLTKTGDLGAVLEIGGIDYESLDHAGRDYAVKRLEAALRSLDDKTRLYQILFKRNHPEILHSEYKNPLVCAAVEQRAAFLESRSDRLYRIEIFWVVMIDGSYRKTGLLHALAQFPKQPRSSLRDLRALLSGDKTRTLLYEQIERDRLRLQQKVNSLSGQLNDLMKIELPGAEETFRILRRLVNFRPSKIHNARLYSTQHIDWQLCDSEHQCGEDPAAVYAAWPADKVHNHSSAVHLSALHAEAGAKNQRGTGVTVAVRPAVIVGGGLDMQLQGVTPKDGVEGRYVPGVGATPVLRTSASAPPRWSLPPPAHR